MWPVEVPVSHLSTMVNHGLLAGQPLPSRRVLAAWLAERGAEVNDGMEITPMPRGEGWRVVSRRELRLGEVLLKVPKPALLSTRTTSCPLPPAPPSALSTASHTILTLALALLHELRLGPDGEYWGYVQSLPRSISIPSLWPLEAEGSDARKAYELLMGTEAERDIRRREGEGVGLASLQSFYTEHGPSLPSTRLHPIPSPFAAFAHAFALVSTRAFVIDMYHLVALCPFADMFNHSSTASHTSLASDDFVCHVCGKLAACEHDTHDPPIRLGHLGPLERAVLAIQPDTVDMYVESPIKRGREIFNTYGEGLSEARLLVEWGFVPGAFPDPPQAPSSSLPDSKSRFAALTLDDDGQESPEDDKEDDAFVGDAATWDLEELCPDLACMVDYDEEPLAEMYDTEDEDRLLCGPSKRPGMLHVNYTGQVSVRLLACFLLQAGAKLVKRDVKRLEAAWAAVQNGEAAELDERIAAVARDVRTLLYGRLQGIQPGKDVGDIYDMREALTEDEPLQRMALTVVINEMALLETAVARWDELLEGIQRQS